MERFLALELASTIRHDGEGGVADDLASPQALAVWLRAQPEAELDPAGPVVDDALLVEVLALRAAVRALFARAVRPGPASPADAGRLLPAAEALDRLNAAAACRPVAPRLDWPEDGEPVLRRLGADGDPTARVAAVLAQAALEFLAGPHREELRACTAPRCVRYFVRGHGRQEYCKPSCSNRARAARHYRRHRPGDEAVSGGWDDDGVATELPRS